MSKIRRFLAQTAGVTAFAALASPAAFSLPLGNAQEAATLKALPAHRAAGAVDFTAIVALDDCSGSLVRFTSSQPGDKALVLTNGHCYEGGFLNAGQVLTHKESTRTFSLLGSDGDSELGTLNATEVVYSTMTDTDVTLYRLDKTYGEIKTAYGVDALTVSDQHPLAGESIAVVSGYWKKIYTCSIDRFVYELKEADWTFKDSILYKQPGCETIGGTSGSPIVSADTKMIVGINNTGNDDGEHCTLDNPCEVDASGHITVTKGASYGQELYLFYGCLGAGNEIDLTLASCQLPKPAHGLAH
jgi:V8-like Glu-specific endopeptidase